MIALLLLVCSVIAVALAALWVRTPALWPPLPELFWHSIESLLGQPATQEDVADREFLVFWIFSFLGLISLLLSGAAANRVRRAWTSV